MRTLQIHVRSGTELPVAAGLPALTLISGTCTLVFARLEHLRAEEDRYQGVLDDAERARAGRFRFDQDRERFVLGHGLLRDVLGRVTDTEATAIRYERGPFGKPSLADRGPHFNFSDTKDAVLIGLCADEPIGVDLETMGRAVDHAAVSNHYFTPEEIAEIGQSPDAKRLFLEYWTRKEAILKASGVGIMEDLRSLGVNRARNEMTITHDDFERLAAQCYHVRTWPIGQSHIISLATENEVEAGLVVQPFAMD
ncbi:MAG: 4'-phosphopantetheinyl transferase superfamily protein [Flavobacteriales bacterium]|nr:4'-phosphopantetheinyl transferase superfamily protein [Flavobacteriales bacterium]